MCEESYDLLNVRNNNSAFYADVNIDSIKTVCNWQKRTETVRKVVFFFFNLFASYMDSVSIVSLKCSLEVVVPVLKL